MNELTVATIDVNSLICKALGNNLKKAQQALVKANGNAWDYAQAMANIVNGKLFEEDFETIEKFADLIGISKSNLSKQARVCAVRTSLKKMDFDTTNITVSWACELLPVHKEEVFEDFVKESGLTTDWTVKEVRDAVKTWAEKHKIDKVQKNSAYGTTKESREETAETAEKETEVADLYTIQLKKSNSTDKWETFEVSVTESELAEIIKMISEKSVSESHN